MSISRSGVSKLIKKVFQDSSLSGLPGSGRPINIIPAILGIEEAQMLRDDDTTTVQLQCILVECGHLLLLKTKNNLRLQTKLGWTFKGSTYCQLI